MNYSLQVRKIKEFLVRSNIDPDLVDVSAEVDRTLEYPENLRLIADKYGIARGHQRDYSAEYCDFLAGDCEQKCNNSSCELFRSEKCPGQLEPCGPEPEPQPAPGGVPKIFCYRDFLIMEEFYEGDKSQQKDYDNQKRPGRKEPPMWGVNLYFIEGMTGAPQEQKGSGISQIFRIIEAIAGHLKKDRQFDTGRAIEKLVLGNSPIISFVQMCIGAGTGKTKCYFDAVKAGIAIRKQTQLALYEYLKLTDTLCEISPGTIPPASDYFERVRDYFRDQFDNDDYFRNFVYIEKPLSDCALSDIETAGTENLNNGDFIFELSDIQAHTIPYHGLWHNGKLGKPRIFPAFDVRGLIQLLKAR